MKQQAKVDGKNTGLLRIKNYTAISREVWQETIKLMIGESEEYKAFAEKLELYCVTRVSGQNWSRARAIS